MKGNDIDRFDEVFRSRLQGFEAETHPDDWKAIEKRLPVSRVSLYRNLRYWAAAAVIALLMVTGSLYLFDGDAEHRKVADEVQKHTEQLQSQMKEEVTPLTATKHIVSASRHVHSEYAVAPPDSDNNNTIDYDAIHTDPVEDIERVDEQAGDEPQPVRSVEPVTAPVQMQKSQQATSEKPSRKWRFGMGGGGLSMGAGNVVPQYSTQSAGLKAEYLQQMNNSVMSDDERMPLPKTNVDHKIPISVGMSVSRILGNRFSLQTGLTYSYLLSEWETNGAFHGKTKQGLHFIGIPLSINYQIAEWQRFRVYATSGIAAEMNVGGRRNTKLYEGDELISKISENVRMKQLMWSLNARVGVSYPLLRFLSAYAEGGAGYYFDNGSDIETIRSEKPFNVNFQLGLRVGF